MFDQFRLVTIPSATPSRSRPSSPSLPLLTLFVLLGVLRMKAWLAGLISLGRRARGGGRRLLHAGRPGPAVGHRGRRVRLLPDPVDRHQRDLGLQPHRRHRALRRAAPLVRAGQPGPCGSRRSSSRSASARCSRRWPASAPRSRSPSVMLMALGFRPIQRRLGRADRQHRAGRVRRARHPDRHAGHVTRRRQRRPAARPSTRSARWSAGRPRSSRSSCRWCWCSSSTAGAACGRPGRPRWSPASSFGVAQFIASNYISVPLDRHRRRAGLGRRRGPAAARLAAGRRSPRAARRRGRRRQAGATRPAVARRPATRRRPPPPDRRRAGGAPRGHRRPPVALATPGPRSLRAYAPYVIIIVLFSSRTSAR